MGTQIYVINRTGLTITINGQVVNIIYPYETQTSITYDLVDKCRIQFVFDGSYWVSMAYNVDSIYANNLNSLSSDLTIISNETLTLQSNNNIINLNSHNYIPNTLDGITDSNGLPVELSPDNTRWHSIQYLTLSNATCVYVYAPSFLGQMFTIIWSGSTVNFNGPSIAGYAKILPSWAKNDDTYSSNTGSIQLYGYDTTTWYIISYWTKNI